MLDIHFKCGKHCFFMKTNLLLDTSFFFRRSLSSTDFKTYLQPGERVLDSERTQAIFIRKVAMDLAFQIKKFADINVSRVILCTDHTSWRKQFFADYKGTRTKDETVNWDKFYELCNYLLGVFKSKNCVLTNIEGLEGDDIIYYYSLLFKKEDNLNIIVSSDNDLKQLVNHNTIVHNIISNKYTVSNDFRLKQAANGPTDIFAMRDDAFLLNRSLKMLSEILRDCTRINRHEILFHPGTRPKPFIDQAIDSNVWLKEGRQYVGKT